MIGTPANKTKYSSVVPQTATSMTITQVNQHLFKSSLNSPHKGIAGLLH